MLAGKMTAIAKRVLALLYYGKKETALMQCLDAAI